MQRDDAIRALDIFKRAINQVNYFFFYFWSTNYFINLNGFCTTPEIAGYGAQSSPSFSILIIIFWVVQVGQLSEFYEVCKTMHIGRGEKLLRIEQV
jgi:hypothetical protein